MDYPKFKVCVRCCTYNQAKFITDAMNGFTMQQTSFPFVCTIVDDASTDGEQDVIRKYLQDNFDFSEGAEAYEKETDYARITYAWHKTNRNCFFVVLLLKENLYSKRQGYKKLGYISEWRDPCEYEALCEGDDYWIVPDKLQKQIDCLDMYPNYSMCTTDAIVQSENGELDWTRYDQDRIVPITDIIENGGLWLQTASFVFRKDIANAMIECGRQCHIGDFPKLLWCALNGNVYYISEKTVLYRFGLGWTQSFKQANIEKKIKAYKSEIDMLKGFDEYSNFKYHETFLKRRKRYMSGIINQNWDHFSFVKDSFKEEYHLLYSFFERLDFFFMQYGLSIIPRIRRKIMSLIIK